MRIAVTGGAGFIGTHTVAQLAGAGHEVFTVDIYPATTHAAVKLGADRHSGIPYVELDVRDRLRCVTVFRDLQLDAVVHLAAIASVPRSVAEPGFVHDVNLTGTMNVLEAARLSGTRRLVYASSAAVYGLNPALPCDESATLQPSSPYAAQKAAGEHLCAAYRACWRLETVALRFFNVFGEQQRADNAYAGAIARFATDLLRGKQGCISGDGEQSRDFIYAADAARAVVAALTVSDPGPGPINVARGESVSVRQLYRTLAELLNVPDHPAFGPPRIGDVRHSLASVERLATMLGVRAETTLADGLARYLRWLQPIAGQRAG